MRFLLRAAFWLGVVVMFIPAESTKPSAPPIGATEAVSAAGAAVSDMRRFCSRQAEACAVGSQVATAFGQKAQAGAKMLYDLVTAEGASQHTLTPVDLAIPWRGPDPRKETDSKRPAEEPTVPMPRTRPRGQSAAS
jgi:hypothetical protein